jgi:hypothetical protein
MSFACGNAPPGEGAPSRGVRYDHGRVPPAGRSRCKMHGNMAPTEDAHGITYTVAAANEDGVPAMQRKGGGPTHLQEGPMCQAVQVIITIHLVNSTWQNHYRGSFKQFHKGRVGGGCLRPVSMGVS